MCSSSWICGASSIFTIYKKSFFESVGENESSSFIEHIFTGELWSNLFSFSKFIDWFFILVCCEIIFVIVEEKGAISRGKTFFDFGDLGCYEESFSMIPSFWDF